MNSAEKVRSRLQTVNWGNHYLSKADEILASDDLEALRSFRYELWAFITRLESRWLSNKAWNSFDEGLQDEIQGIYDDLRAVELAFARRDSELERGRVIREKMEQAALPEPRPGFLRNISNWNRGPLLFSERFNRRMRRARLPERRGV